MRETKCRLEPYSFFNPSGICRHLERQAAEGWMLEKITNWGWHYRRAAPKKLHFAVSYYAKASEFDPEPTEGQLRFQEFCAHTGWELVCGSAQLQIFCNGQEDPTPIWTEPELELEATHAAAKKSYLPIFSVYLLLSLTQGIMFIGNLITNPIHLLSSPSQLVTGVCFTLLLVLSLTELVGYFCWYARARKAVGQGSLPMPPDTSRLQKIILVIVILAGAYWLVSTLVTGDNLMRWLTLAMCVYLPLLFFLVNGTKTFLKRKKASRGLNRALTYGASFLLAFLLMGLITWFFLSASAKGWFTAEGETYEYRGSTFELHQDELPLTVEDLVDVDYEEYIRERRESESLFLGQLVLRQYPRFDAADYANIHRLEYTVVLVKMPWLYELCKEELIGDKEDRSVSALEYREEDASPWGAKEAYRLYGEYGPRAEWLLCYENTLVEIDFFDLSPTAEQKRIVGEKLGG